MLNIVKAPYKSCIYTYVYLSSAVYGSAQNTDLWPLTLHSTTPPVASQPCTLVWPGLMKQDINYILWGVKKCKAITI